VTFIFTQYSIISVYRIIERPDYQDYTVHRSNTVSGRLVAHLGPVCLPCAAFLWRRSTHVTEESMLPWRAQVLVTKTENHKKKCMIIDNSQTINRFTLLDAYPLPNINDLAPKVAQYST